MYAIAQHYNNRLHIPSHLNRKNTLKRAKRKYTKCRKSPVRTEIRTSTECCTTYIRTALTSQRLGRKGITSNQDSKNRECTVCEPSNRRQRIHILSITTTNEDQRGNQVAAGETRFTARLWEFALSLEQPDGLVAHRLWIIATHETTQFPCRTNDSGYPVDGRLR
jgi:hypothetical protein